MVVVHAPFLPRTHTDLSELLCEEVMTRQRKCGDSLIQHSVLTCLAPWMQNLVVMPHWRGTW